MGVRSWLRARLRHIVGSRDQGRSRRSAPAKTLTPAPVKEIAPGYPESDWVEVPAYLPVDPSEHRVACIIASAIAAGDHPESSLTVKRVLLANPEHQCVSAIATAIGAGDREESSFVVRRIWRDKRAPVPGARSDAAPADAADDDLAKMMAGTD